MSKLTRAMMMAAGGAAASGVAINDYIQIGTEILKVAEVNVGGTQMH